MAYVKGKSGTLDFVGTHSFTLRVKWSETYDLEKNTSILSIDGMQMQSTVYGGTYYLGGSAPDYGTLKVDGVLLRTMNYNGNATHAVSVNAGSSWWDVRAINTGYHDDNQFPWVTGEIAHNADGSKKVDLVLNMDLWRSSIQGHRPEWLDVTMSIDLTDIPRASTATVPDFTMGTKGTISISRASSAFTHTLSVKLGSKTYQLATGVSTSYAWTPSVSTWAPRITDAASASCTMVIDTYNGSTKLGSREYTFTLSVPASVVPSISAFSVELVNDNAAVNGWGIAVKTLTKLAWSITAAGSNGSTIKSYAFTAGSLKGSGATGTTSALAAAGNVTFSATVTDSRGRTATATGETITVYDYYAPTISRAEIYRCLENGTEDNSGSHLKLNITGKIASVNGKNTATYQYRSMIVNGSFGSWTAFEPGAVVPGFSSDTSYVVEMRVVDAPGKNASTSITIPTREEWLHGKDGGKGAAFGKVAEEDNLLDVAWDLRVRGNLILDNPLPGTGGAEIEYPLSLEKGGTGADLSSVAQGRVIAKGSNGLSYWTSVPIAQGGTGATTAEAARNALGAVAIERVWTNASPASSFAGQTLEIDLSAYDAYIVVARQSTSMSNAVSVFQKTGAHIRLVNLSYSSSLSAYSRVADYTSSGLKFYAAYSNANTDNTVLIPIYIYGVKGVQ